MSTESAEVGAQESLADIIKGTEPAKVPEPVKTEAKSEPPPAKTEEPAKAERPRGDDGKFKSKEEPAKEATKPEEEPQKTAKPDWVNGLIAERRKRQAAEAAAAKPPAKTDFFENAEKAFDERIGEREAKWNERFFKLSLKAAQGSRTDYDDVATAFADAAERDPRLIDAMRADDDPGEFIYVVGKQIRELGDVGGDIGKYRDKVRGEFSTQLSDKDKRIAALEAEVEKSKKDYEALSTVRGSLNTRTSGRTSVAGTDDDDLKSIVRFGNAKPG